MHSKPLALTGALFLCAAVPASAQLTPIFGDTFESGNTFAWALSVGEPPLAPAESFRLTDLDLRDPHLFVDVPIVGCFDFTDQALPLGLGPSFNGQLQTLIATDGDGDGFLDLSALVQFRPLSTTTSGLRLDLAGASCTDPPATTTCDREPGSIPQTFSYSLPVAATCLTPLAGTTSGYTPAVGSSPAPCWVSSSRPITLNLGGVSLPLIDFQIATTFAGAPPTSLETGLMRGFLRESDADLVLLPPDLPLIGGQPLSILLRGGTGNCATGSDKDVHLGVSGWWFYLNFPAEPVPWTGI